MFYLEIFLNNYHINSSTVFLSIYLFFIQLFPYSITLIYLTFYFYLCNGIYFIHTSIFWKISSWSTKTSVRKLLIKSNLNSMTQKLCKFVRIVWKICNQNGVASSPILLEMCVFYNQMKGKRGTRTSV